MLASGSEDLAADLDAGCALASPCSSAASGSVLRADVDEMNPFFTHTVEVHCCAMWYPRFLHLVEVIKQSTAAATPGLLFMKSHCMWCPWLSYSGFT